MQPVSPPCATCRHRIFGDVCEAFPGGGIPPDILSGENDHRKPVDGDGGIRYEPVELKGASDG